MAVAVEIDRVALEGRGHELGRSEGTGPRPDQPVRPNVAALQDFEGRKEFLAKIIAAASDAGLLAARSALQTHGAIGFTQEHDLSLWLLRVQALRSAWGDAAAHRRRVLEAL